MLQKRYRSYPLFCGIEATTFAISMLVVVMTLLVIELANPHPTPGVREHLPKVSHPVSMWRAGKWDALTVIVMRDGKVFLGRDQLQPSDLPYKIRDGIEHGAEPKVYIRADVRARYGWVKQVLVAVRASGVENIAFNTDQRRSESSVR